MYEAFFRNYSSVIIFLNVSQRNMSHMMDFNADYIPLTSNMDQASGNNVRKSLTTKTAKRLSLNLKINHLKLKLDEVKGSLKSLQGKNDDLLLEIQSLREERDSLLQKMNLALALEDGARDALGHLNRRMESIQSKRLDEKVVAFGCMNRYSKLIAQLRKKNLLHLIEMDEI